MKRFVLFAGVLVSAVWMLGAIPVDSSPEGSPEEKDWPKQTICTDVPALPYHPHTMAGPKAFTLYVGRIMSQYTPPTEDPTAPNLCSPLSYDVKACQGTQIHVKINEDGSKVVKMASYDQLTNNVVCYDQTPEIQGEHYNIFKAKVNQMTLLDVNGEPTAISTLPQTVNDFGDTMIAAVRYGKDMSYAIYASCLKNAVWVAYSDRIVSENLIDGLQEEIDAQLKDLGYEPTEFIKVPTTIPINLDKCFG